MWGTGTFFGRKEKRKKKALLPYCIIPHPLKNAAGKEDYEQVVSARLRSCDKSATFLIDVGEKVSGIERGRRRRRVV